MNENLEKFIECLIKGLPNGEQKYKEVIEYWLPDFPPSTIILGELGDELADSCQSLERDNLKRIFDTVEDGMKSDDDALSTAVATGLVEAMANNLVRNGKWNMARDLLGPQTLAHANAWLNF